MKRMLLLAMAVLLGHYINAQLLTWTPPFPKENDPSQTLVITVDATKGNQGLLNYTPASDVYVHIGVITNQSTSSTDWRHVPFTWGTTAAAANAPSAGTNKWQFTISGSLRTFFNITDPNESIIKIAILFRNGNGSRKQANTDGTDMYVPVYGNNLAVRIDQPASQPKFIPVPETQNWIVGSTINITANANKPSVMKLYHNGNLVASQSNVQTISGTSTVTALGNQQLIAEANDGTTTKYDTMNIFVSPSSSPIAALPPGVQDGINYEPGDTSATLVLRAPGKNKVTLIGDFNNWIQNTNHVLNKTPDGKFFWIRLHPLTAGVEYAYQYVVDDTIRIADPYTEKILDPNNDQFVSPSTYPNLKPYPAGQTGIVSILQTAKPTYAWSSGSFNRPDKKSLVIYEVLIRDFVAAHDWKTVKDSLNYLKNLGVNAIEIMPFNDFQFNLSWGYDPIFYFAPEKYYGPENTIRQFVDSCHKKGIAVIMDIVLNHSYELSPMAMLYWDAQNNRPSAANPWYNPVAPHAFGFGVDFNHESNDTKYFFNRVLQHWITNYRIDGYRFDFSKGLTQRPSSNDAQFSAYDNTRIAIINGYYNTIKAVDPNEYLVLEHFCDNTEEKQLADSGMLIWGNMNGAYIAASTANPPTSDLSGGIYSVRGWTNPHLVTYMESHDEERIMYRNINSGASNANYNIRDTTTALKRMELDATFLLTIPGPKMIWQFGELGYDYSINYCTNGTVNNNCRLDPKPIRWDYVNDPRRKHVYSTYSKLDSLRNHPWYRSVFMTGAVTRDLSSAFKWMRITSPSDTSDVVVVGNFDITQQIGTVTFPVAGTWYDYFNNSTFNATGSGQPISLQPGEFRVFLNRNVNNLTPTPVPNVQWNGTTLEATVYPNPASTNFTVEMNLPQTGNVRIELYNNLGQSEGIVYSGMLTKGTRPIALKRSQQLNGVYYLKITTRTATKTIQVNFQ